MKKTLLERFIEDALGRFVEPTRKGLPKGSTIGPSRKKYHAALLTACTNLGLTQVASLTGISYGLLVKWRSEDAFKYLVTRFVNDFLYQWRDSLHNYAKQYYDIMSDVNRKLLVNDEPGAKLLLVKSENLLQQYRDADCYSEEIRIEIFEVFDLSEDMFFHCWHLAVHLMEQWKDSRVQSYVVRMRRLLLRACLDYLDDYIKKPLPTEDEKKLALKSVKDLRDAILP